MHSKVREIIESMRYLTVSTTDESGNAMAAPVWFTFDDKLNFYWWSPINSKHSINIARDHRGYVTIFDSNAPEGDGLGVYAQCDIRVVDDSELNEVIESYNNTTSIFKLSIENCSGKAPTRIYKATPSKIWLNDGEVKNGFWEDFRTEV